jgi:hypothetical protein
LLFEIQAGMCMQLTLCWNIFCALLNLKSYLPIWEYSLLCNMTVKKFVSIHIFRWYFKLFNFQGDPPQAGFASPALHHEWCGYLYKHNEWNGFIELLHWYLAAWIFLTCTIIYVYYIFLMCPSLFFPIKIMLLLT